MQIFEMFQICKHLVLQYWGSLWNNAKILQVWFSKKFPRAILQEFTTKKLECSRACRCCNASMKAVLFDLLCLSRKAEYFR